MPKLLWTQKQDIGPEPRRAHAMAYDPGRKRALLEHSASWWHGDHKPSGHGREGHVGLERHGLDTDL